MSNESAPVVPPLFHDRAALAAHAAVEHRVLALIARGEDPNLAMDGITGDPIHASREAIFSLACRGYLLPALRLRTLRHSALEGSLGESHELHPTRIGVSEWGWQLDEEKGERLARGEDQVPTVEALAASYVAEAVRPQHRLLCGYLGRGVHGPAEARGEVTFRGARWEAVVNFGKVADARVLLTLESQPLYAFDLYRNGDRLPQRWSALGEPVGFGLWDGGRPTQGKFVVLAGSLPREDWPVLQLLTEQLLGAGAAVEAAYPLGWTGRCAWPVAIICMRGAGGLRATRQNPEALLLGLRSGRVMTDETLKTQADVDAAADEALAQDCRSAGMPLSGDHSAPKALGWPAFLAKELEKRELELTVQDAECGDLLSLPVGQESPPLYVAGEDIAKGDMMSIKLDAGDGARFAPYIVYGHAGHGRGPKATNRG